MWVFWDQVTSSILYRGEDSFEVQLFLCCVENGIMGLDLLDHAISPTHLGLFLVGYFSLIMGQLGLFWAFS